jgi:hypothetical protein
MPKAMFNWAPSLSPQGVVTSVVLKSKSQCLISILCSDFKSEVCDSVYLVPVSSFELMLYSNGVGCRKQLKQSRLVVSFWRTGVLQWFTVDCLVGILDNGVPRRPVLLEHLRHEIKVIFINIVPPYSVEPHP